MANVYIIPSGNCDSDSEGEYVGTEAWSKKAAAIAAARELAEDHLDELNGSEDDEPMYKVVKEGDCFWIVDTARNFKCEFWYVQKMLLK